MVHREIAQSRDRLVLGARRNDCLGELSRACLLIAALLLGRASVQAQADTRQDAATLRGRIVDAQTRAAIDRVSIVAARGAETVASGYTDSIGAFGLHVAESGPVDIHLRRLGYRATTFMAVESRSGVPLEMSMIPIPQAIDGMAVAARGASSLRVVGFENRLARHVGGTFITRQQLESWNAVRTTDVIRRVSGVKLIDSSGVLLVVSTRGYKVDLIRSDFMAPCGLRVLVDGQVMEPGFSVDRIDPTQIHGIEVYNGPATIPPEFNSVRRDAYCGLVMIWTR